MSNLKYQVIVTQREKNQITIPSDIAKKLKAKKGTKYKISIDSNGDIKLQVVKNDIRKYIGIIKPDKQATQIIKQIRKEDETKVFKD